MACVTCVVGVKFADVRDVLDLCGSHEIGILVEGQTDCTRFSVYHLTIIT